MLTRAAAAAALTASFALLRAQEESSFQVDVSLVNVLVTVKDAKGAVVGGLDREDFKILDGGVPRPVVVFERRTDRPLSVSLMIDASLSTAIELQQERVSAQGFIENLLREGSHPADRVSVVKFSAYVDLVSDFTRSIPKLVRALRSVRAESGTSMYDAILLASEELAGREGRRVMIIITDGGDTTSNTTFQRALKATHAIDAVIYGIIVMPIKSDAGRNTGGENALKALASSTGGATFVLLDKQDDLDDAFAQILRNLRTQYLLGYYPPELTESTETFRPIQVSVNREGATVLARTGYFVPERRRPAPGNPEDRISIRPKTEGPPVAKPAPAGEVSKKEP